MNAFLAGLLVLLLAGCAAFEQTPADLEKKLSDPTRGRLYERDPLERR
jgi:hypothetical protein